MLEIGALVLLTAGSLVSWAGWVGGVLLLWTSDLGPLEPARQAGRDAGAARWARAAWWFARGPATVVCTTLVAGDGSPRGGPGCDPLPYPLLVVLAIQVLLVVVPVAASAWLGWRLRRTSG